TLTSVFSVYAVLITALNSSLAIAGCTGLCIGFLSSMSGSYAVIMMGVYGLGALFAGFMNSFKRIGCAIGYISGTAVTLIYIKNIYDVPLGMIDTFIGAALFLLTPNIVHEYFRTFFTRSMQVEAVSPDLRMREYLVMRLRKAGEAFCSLHECFIAVSEGRLKKYSDDVGVILDETAERVCKGCKLCGKCWQTDFRRTYKNALGLIGIIEKDGSLNSANVPEHFCDRCVRTDWFIYEINHVYELYKRDVLRRSDAVVTRDLISTQYGELNKLFNGMAGDIEEGFRFLETEEEKIVDGLDKLGIIPYEVSAIESTSGSCEVYLRLPPVVRQNAVEGVISEVLKRSVSFEKTEEGLSKYVSRPDFTVEASVLQLPQEHSNVNGDSVTVFNADGGRFYAIIADGMGSGSEAKYESTATLRLLTSFLKSGFSVKTALGILNSALCLNMNNEMFSTVDLLCIDLYSGKAEIYKIGSAETVILNGDEVKILSSNSIPVGILSDIRLDNRSISLSEGDVILMLTDGITEAGYAASRMEWLRNIIIKPFETMEELAKEVMDTALSKNKDVAKDDMSVIALRIMGT
ncbi:MAG: SpoIIE family protein phosphatase, partial [Candidatus Ornithomonoglobus sp.]